MKPMKPTRFKDNPYRPEWSEQNYLYTMEGPRNADKHGCYKTFKLSERYIRNFRTAVDIGCRLGEYTRYLSERFEQVYAFDARLFNDFRYNVDLTKVRHYHCALGDEVGPIQMCGGNHDLTRKLKEHTIDCFRLDDFHPPHVDYIKIDVEGYETKVLKGALETIRKSSPLIVIEQNGVTVDGEDRYAARDLLISLGYRVAAIDKRGWDHVMIRD